MAFYTDTHKNSFLRLPEVSLKNGQLNTTQINLYANILFPGFLQEISSETIAFLSNTEISSQWIWLGLG